MIKTVAYINEAACERQRPCPASDICPIAAIKINGRGYPYVISQKCVGCRKCLHYCSSHAIKMKKVTL